MIAKTIMASAARRKGGKHTIRVAVRVRPLMGGGGGESGAVATDKTGALLVRGDARFTFPSVVVKGSDQATAFDALAAPLLARLREGYSCTLLAYGQTGSGKTHTMFGPTGCLTEAKCAAYTTADSPVWLAIRPKFDWLWRLLLIMIPPRLVLLGGIY